MAIPDYQSLMLPLLVELKDGREHNLGDVRDRVAAKFGLTESDREELLPSGKQSVFDNRLGWAKTYLDKAGLLRSIKRGVYQVTDRGKAALKSGATRIDLPYLAQFSEFTEFRETSEENRQPRVPRTAAPGNAAGDAAGEAQQAIEKTPEEALEIAHAQIRRTMEADVLAAVLKASPRFFEKLVVELLVKMGYGGTLEDAGKALGGSRDGGVDGMIKEDALGLDVIYVQAKRWKNDERGVNKVGRPELQAFAGSLEGERARKGVFITTSQFSQEARDYVRRIDKRIVLVDGAQLAALMVDHDLGVNTVATYAIKRVDTDYFSEE